MILLERDIWFFIEPKRWGEREISSFRRSPSASSISGSLREEIRTSPTGRGGSRRMSIAHCRLTEISGWFRERRFGFTRSRTRDRHSPP